MNTNYFEFINWLSNNGFELGKDFSIIAEDKIILSEEVGEFIKQKYPDIYNRIENKKDQLQQEQLEKYLGEGFFTRLKHNIQMRIVNEEITPKQALYYLMVLSNGFTNKYPGSENIIEAFINKTIQELINFDKKQTIKNIYFKINEKMKECKENILLQDLVKTKDLEEVNECVWIEDILKALNVYNEKYINYDKNNNLLLSFKGLIELNKVIDSEEQELREAILDAQAREEL